MGKIGVRRLLYAANSAKFNLGYPSRLLIYDAGDYRTSWISFWKAVAILECGTALVFAVPPVWKNENQPDPNLRKAQAILSRCCPNKFIPLICPMPRSFITSLVLTQPFYLVLSVVDSLCLHTPGDCFTASISVEGPGQVGVSSCPWLMPVHLCPIVSYLQCRATLVSQDQPLTSAPQLASSAPSRP